MKGLHLDQRDGAATRECREAGSIGKTTGMKSSVFFCEIKYFS